jgi:hypothetical protein
VDIMQINKPDDLGDIANLGLTLAEAKQLLARVQCEIATAQTREHAVRRKALPADANLTTRPRFVEVSDLDPTAIKNFCTATFA